MPLVTMYVTRWCPYCIEARRLLDGLGVEHVDIDVGADWALRADMERLSGRRTVPQIWVGDRHVGGCDDLMELHGRGLLTQWLDEASREQLNNSTQSIRG